MENILIKNSEYADIIIALDERISTIDKAIENAEKLNVQKSIEFWKGQKERVINTKARFKQIIHSIDKMVILS
jgi:23S rRNA G2445 N2-methylase RlmL